MNTKHIRVALLSFVSIVVYVPQGAEVRYRIWAAKPGNLIAPSK